MTWGRRLPRQVIGYNQTWVGRTLAWASVPEPASWSTKGALLSGTVTIEEHFKLLTDLFSTSARDSLPHRPKSPPPPLRSLIQLGCAILSHKFGSGRSSLRPLHTHTHTHKHTYTHWVALWHRQKRNFSCVRVYVFERLSHQGFPWLLPNGHLKWLISASQITWEEQLERNPGDMLEGHPRPWKRNVAKGASPQDCRGADPGSWPSPSLPSSRPPNDVPHRIALSKLKWPPCGLLPDLDTPYERHFWVINGDPDPYGPSWTSTAGSPNIQENVQKLKSPPHSTAFWLRSQNDWSSPLGSRPLPLVPGCAPPLSDPQ